MTIAEVPAEHVLNQLDGAQIVCSYVENDNGMHMEFADGRSLVIIGNFAICIVPQERKDLH